MRIHDVRDPKCVMRGGIILLDLDDLIERVYGLRYLRAHEVAHAFIHEAPVLPILVVLVFVECPL